MPEDHFTRSSADEARRLRGSLRATLGESVRSVRGHPVLLLILGVAALHGMSSEAFDRLADLHLLRIGLPAFGVFDRILWFGVLDGVALLVGVAATAYVRRSVDLEHVNGAARALVVIDALLIASVATFGLASAFFLALGANWLVRGLRTVRDAVFVGWLNRGLDPRTRATVNSIAGQADAIGQTIGGPILGVVAVVRSVAAALVGAAIVNVPVFGLYARAIKRGSVGALDPEEVGPLVADPPPGTERVSPPRRLWRRGVPPRGARGSASRRARSRAARAACSRTRAARSAAFGRDRRRRGSRRAESA
jgi:hypothetical protein